MDPKHSGKPYIQSMSFYKCHSASGRQIKLGKPRICRHPILSATIASVFLVSLTTWKRMCSFFLSVLCSYKCGFTLYMHPCVVQLQLFSFSSCFVGGEKQGSQINFRGFYLQKMRCKPEQTISEKRIKAEPLSFERAIEW